jgi:hypothetical protein
MNYHVEYDYNATYGEDCGLCEIKRAKYICVECCAAVCTQPRCCEVFPHTNNTKIIICSTCFKFYEQKLNPEINHAKLAIIKKKANSRKKELQRIQMRALSEIEDNISRMILSKNNQPT